MLAIVVAALLTAPSAYPTLPPQPELKAPRFAPDGTYFYGLYRGRTRIGSTTVVVQRRKADNRIEVYESGSYGTVSVRTHGALAYRDLLPKPWDVTYTGVPLPEAGMLREKLGHVDRYTVRYELDQDGSFDLIDGAPGGDVYPLWSWRGRHVKYFTIFDPPFMAGVIAIPPTLALRKESYVFTLSETNTQNDGQEQTIDREEGANKRVIQAQNFKLSYDPKSMIVHDAWFPKLDLRARLESVSPRTSAAISFGAP